MLNCAVAATSRLPTDARLNYVIGEPEQFCARPLEPCTAPVRAFLSRLSAELVYDKASSSMPDVISFAWWCRKANLERLSQVYDDGTVRLGRGLAFHVTPANMPVNFAFSWAFSLMAGNANVVRLPTRDFPQIPFLLRHVSRLFGEPEFMSLRAMNAFVAYGREQEITAAFSALADVRIIWGGDATIAAIRKASLPARGIDVCFADRCSFCVVGAAQVLELADPALERLAGSFFNDTYIMDQNACSSPHLVVWVGGEDQAAEAGGRFWSAVQQQIDRRYEISSIAAIDKFAQACRDAIELDPAIAFEREDNRLVRLRLSEPFPGIESRRCHSGYFYEWVIPQLHHAAAMVTSKYQTLTYFGLPREELASFVTSNRLPGIDRIVPVGEAMDIGPIWDGFDLIRTLSRVCDIR
jgi:hypothetical protein